MGNIKRAIKKHKTGFIIGGLVISLFVVFSTINAVHVAKDRAAQNTRQEQASSQASSTATSTAGDTSTAPDVKLTDEQKKQISKYDDTTKELIASLEASTWVADNGTDNVRFTGGSRYTETIGGKQATHTYVITRLTSEEVNATDQQGAGTLTTAVFKTDTGDHVVTYWTAQKNDTQTSDEATQAEQAPSELSSPTMFQRQDAKYKRAQTVKEISVGDIDPEALKALGGDKDKLVKELNDWCAVNFPLVQKAEWNNDLSIDYKNKEAQTTFNVTFGDEETGTEASVTAVYNTEDKTFTFHG